MNPIEIPPPRPKKKPLHPYPHKIANSAKTEVKVSHQLGRSHSPNVSVPERENLSPTSVLSVICSDTVEAAVVEMHKNRVTPASSTTDAHSAHSLFIERDEEYVTSNVSAKEEIGSHLSRETSFASVADDKITMVSYYFHLFSY